MSGGLGSRRARAGPRRLAAERASQDGINVYLVEDVLIDAATKRAPKRILGQLQGRKVSAHALTHAHPDHQGASSAVCDALGIPYWVGETDVPLAEDLDNMRASQTPHPLNRMIMRFWCGPARPVDRHAARGRRGRRIPRARRARALARAHRLLA